MVTWLTCDDLGLDDWVEDRHVDGGVSIEESTRMLFYNLHKSTVGKLVKVTVLAGRKPEVVDFRFRVERQTPVVVTYKHNVITVS